MAAPQNPPGFTARTEAQQAAFENGFRLDEHWDGAWGRWRSATAPGAIWIAGAGPYDGPWFLALEHAGAITELGLAPASMIGPGVARFVLPSRASLQQAMARVYRLSMSLPTAPLERFHRRLAELPPTTEIEALVRRRVGQDVFRESLMEYWEGRCPITGIGDAALPGPPWFAHSSRAVADALDLSVNCFADWRWQSRGTPPHEEPSLYRARGRLFRVDKLALWIRQLRQETGSMELWHLGADYASALGVRAQSRQQLDDALMRLQRLGALPAPRNAPASYPHWRWYADRPNEMDPNLAYDDVTGNQKIGAAQISNANLNVSIRS